MDIDTNFDGDDNCVITGMFDDLDTMNDEDYLIDTIKLYPEIVIQSVDIDDILSNNNERYNTNNIWINNKKPADYKSVSDECNTDKWIDKFH